MMNSAQQYIDATANAARSADFAAVEKFLSLLETAYAKGRSVFLVGNGGSAANASHFAEDLANAVPDLKGKRLKVLSLTDNTSYITALANDYGYENVFDIQLRPFARPRDVLIAISGSGRSRNVLEAARFARRRGLRVVSFTGFSGGELMRLADIRIHVPLNDMCKTEAAHSILFHMIADTLRARLRKLPRKLGR